MAIPSFPRTLNPPETAVLWSPHEEQLSGALVGNLKSSPCPERNYEELVCLSALHSAVVVSSAFSGVIFSLPFLPWKSPRLLLISADIQATHVSLKMDTVLTMKYLMFFFCLLVFIGSLCLIFVAIWVIYDPTRILDIYPNYFLTIAAWIVLLVGLLLLWVSYVGIYATVVEDVKLLLNFFVLVLVISIVELLVAILLYFYADKIRDEYLINQLVDNYEGDSGTNAYSKALNGLMIMLQCCGILGPADFQSAQIFKEKQPSDLWPRACCTRGKPPQADNILHVKACQRKMTGFINNIGCFSAIAYLFNRYMWTFVGCSLGVLAAEIFAMATAWYLHRKLDD